MIILDDDPGLTFHETFLLGKNSLQRYVSDFFVPLPLVTLAQNLEQGTRIGIDPTLILAGMSSSSASVICVDPCEQQPMLRRSKSLSESLNWSLFRKTLWILYGVLSARNVPKIQSLL